MKSKKGITLIALIITIIVMLILVAVTINVALNGGIFEKAKDASNQTEEKAILEKIIAMATWNDDGTIDVGNTITEVEKEFNSVTNNGDGTYTIKGKTGEYKYEITKDKIAIASKTSEGKHQLNQYGFYEDVVYEINEEHVELNNLDSPNYTEYLFIGKNLSVIKMQAIVGGTVMFNQTIPNSQIQIKNNPTYEIKDGIQQIPGTIIELANEPFVKIENQGELSGIAATTYGDEIISYEVIDRPYVPNFELDPDVIFAE